EHPGCGADRTARGGTSRGRSGRHRQRRAVAASPCTRRRAGWRALVRRLQGDQRGRHGEEPRVVRRTRRPVGGRRGQGRRLCPARRGGARQGAPGAGLRGGARAAGDRARRCRRGRRARGRPARCGRRRGGRCAARRRRPARPGLLELRHVHGLCGAGPGVPCRGGGVAMTGAEALDAALEPRPVFRGPLANQRPRIVRTFGSDPWLVLAVAALVSLGTVMVFNVSYFPGGDDFGDPLHFFRKHLISIAGGLGLCVITMRMGSDRFRAFAYPLLVVAALAIILLPSPPLAPTPPPARRWLAVGPLTFQPSELAKFAVVLYLARSLARRAERIRELWHGIVPHVLVVG